MAAKKNSLVENINRRKRAGKSRPKSRSTISSSAYADMQQGWPSKKKRASGKKKRASGKKKRASGKKKRTRASQE